MTDQWLCKGMPSAIWFEDQWTDTPYSMALENARDLCDQCPGRGACLKLALAAEGEDGIDYRAGIYAGTTPQQRHAIYKRGLTLACAECSTPYDPALLRRGVLDCVCGHRRTAALPDRGDQWTERHTKLARMAIGWMIVNVQVGGEVPDALALSRKMKVAVKDLRRVYQALKDDHVIRRSDTGKLVYRGNVESVDRWLPPHLRKVLALSQ